MDPSQTWLEFQFTPVFTTTTNSSPQVAALDGSANSLIKKIEIYSSAGSNLLESIDNYGVLYQACANVVSDVDDMSSTGSVLEGYKAPLAIIAQNDAAAATRPFVNYLSDTIKTRSVNGIALTSGTTYTFQIPLMCLIGTLGDKYIPLHALAADLRVEITWNTAIASFVSVVSASATAGDWPITTTKTAGAVADPGYYSASSTFSTPALGTGFNNAVNDAAPVLTGVTTGSDYFTNVYLHCGMVQVSVRVSCYSRSFRKHVDSRHAIRALPIPRTMPRPRST